MSQTTLAGALVAALKSRGVERIFGVPGGGSSLDLIEAAGRQGVQFVLCRGETAAALMAAVTAELTGAPGVVLTGIGPGAASAVNGIAYASLERAPLVAITDAREPGDGWSLHQVFDQQALFRPVTKASRRLTAGDGGQAIEALLDCALTAPFGPVHIDLSASEAGKTLSEDVVPAAAPTRAATVGQEDMQAAQRLVAASRRAIIVLGLQARTAEASAAAGRLADRLACPVLTTYKAKGVLADDHPLVVGHFTGARADAEVLDQADLLVFAGVDPIEIIPTAWSSPAPLLVLSTHDGLAFPMAPTTTLCGLLPSSIDDLAKRASPSDWQPAEIRGLAKELRARLQLAGDGHTAQSVVQAAAELAAPRARIAVDSGAHMFSIMALWPATAPHDALKSNGLSTMGFALPAAIASALVEPRRPVIAFTGDGGLMMCLAELATAAQHGCRLTVVVLNDAALSLIDVKQRRQQCPPEGVRYPAPDFAAAARGLGCRAWSVTSDQPLEPVLREALGYNGPGLVDVAVDPTGYGEQLSALRG